MQTQATHIGTSNWYVHADVSSVSYLQWFQQRNTFKVAMRQHNCSLHLLRWFVHLYEIILADSQLRLTLSIDFVRSKKRCVWSEYMSRWIKATIVNKTMWSFPFDCFHFPSSIAEYPSNWAQKGVLWLDPKHKLSRLVVMPHWDSNLLNNKFFLT